MGNGIRLRYVTVFDKDLWSRNDASPLNKKR